MQVDVCKGVCHAPGSSATARRSPPHLRLLRVSHSPFPLSRRFSLRCWYVLVYCAFHVLALLAMATPNPPPNGTVPRYHVRPHLSRRYGGAGCLLSTRQQGGRYSFRLTQAFGTSAGSQVALSDPPGAVGGGSGGGGGGGEGGSVAAALLRASWVCLCAWPSQPDVCSNAL